MKQTLTTALLALAAAAGAGLPTAGLPAGNTTFGLHLSNETIDQTQLGKALTSAFQAEVDADPVVATLKRELGFTLDEDFRDLTVVGNIGDEKSPVALVRGKFNKARIEDFAARNGVPSRAVKGLKAWDIEALGAAIAKAAGKEADTANKGNGEIVIVDGNTVVIADASAIERAVAAATAGTPWKNEGLSRAAASVQNGWLLISADVAAIEAYQAAQREASDEPPSGAPAKKSGIKVLTLATGESSTDLTLRAHADCVDEAAAKRNVAQAKGLLGFGAMLTLPGENDSEDVAAQKESAGDLIRRISISQSGSAINASLDYPIQKVAQNILRAAQLRKEQKAGAKGK